MEHFPISFVIKSIETIDALREKLKTGAQKQFGVQRVVDSYLACIEEIINIPVLQERFRHAEGQGYLPQILDEIVKQSKVEFNYTEQVEAGEVVDDDEDTDATLEP